MFGCGDMSDSMYLFLKHNLIGMEFVTTETDLHYKVKIRGVNFIMGHCIMCEVSVKELGLTTLVALKYRKDMFDGREAYTIKAEDLKIIDQELVLIHIGEKVLSDL